MESLYVYRSVTELLDAILLTLSRECASVSRSNISVHIATKGGQVTDERLLFHVKVCSNQKVNLEECQKDLGSSLSDVCGLLHLMQSVDDESHLCVQTCDPYDANKLIQRNYRASSHHDDQPVLQCMETYHKTRRGLNGSNIILRVYEKRSEMMLSSKKIYHYLRLISFVWPKVSLSFSMKIQDNICNFEFESPAMQCESGHFICGNANYILKDSQYSALTPSVMPYCGDQQHIQGVQIGGEQVLSVTVRAVASVIKCRWKKDLKSLLMISGYGPHRLPLQTNAESWVSVLHTVPWTEYGFKLQQNCDRNIHLNADLVLGLEDVTNHKRCHHCLIIFLFIESEVNSSGEILAKWLKVNKSTFISKYTEEVSRAVSSAVSRALSFRVNSADSKTTRCYSKAIPCIAKSISSILLRSSNEEFRRKSFQLLKVESSRAAESSLTVKLWEIAKSCHGVVAPSGVSQRNYSATSTTIVSSGEVGADATPSGINTELIPQTSSQRQNIGNTCLRNAGNITDKEVRGLHLEVDKSRSSHATGAVSNKEVSQRQGCYTQSLNSEVSKGQTSSQQKVSDLHSTGATCDVDFHSLSEAHDYFYENEGCTSENTSEIQTNSSNMSLDIPKPLTGGDNRLVGLSDREQKGELVCSDGMVLDDEESKDHTDLMRLQENESDLGNTHQDHAGDGHFHSNNDPSHNKNEDSEVWFDDVLMEVQDWLNED